MGTVLSLPFTALRLKRKLERSNSELTHNNDRLSKENGGLRYREGILNIEVNELRASVAQHKALLLERLEHIAALEARVGQYQEDEATIARYTNRVVEDFFAARNELASRNELRNRPLEHGAEVVAGGEIFSVKGIGEDEVHLRRNRDAAQVGQAAEVLPVATGGVVGIRNPWEVVLDLQCGDKVQ